MCMESTAKKVTLGETALGETALEIVVRFVVGDLSTTIPFGKHLLHIKSERDIFSHCLFIFRISASLMA